MDALPIAGPIGPRNILKQQHNKETTHQPEHLMLFKPYAAKPWKKYNKVLQNLCHGKTSRTNCLPSSKSLPLQPYEYI